MTYADVPKGGTLNVRDWQLFAKRLRRKKGSLRFYLAGEYGERLKRPHYHALLFGVDFPDQEAVRKEAYGEVFRSEELEKLWGLGTCEVGEVNMKSAQYCAGYLKNKVYGEAEKAKVYGRVDPETGECFQVRPEFQTVSTRPAIGKAYLERYWKDIWATDTIVVEGLEMPTPRYYRKVLKERDPELAEYWSEQRIMKAEASRDQGQKRRETIEKVWELREAERERVLD